MEIHGCGFIRALVDSEDHDVACQEWRKFNNIFIEVAKDEDERAMSKELRP